MCFRCGLFMRKELKPASHLRCMKLKNLRDRTSLQRFVLIFNACQDKLRCETCFLTLREERKLRVFANRMMRKISGIEGRRTRAWMKLGKELHDRYSSPSAILGIKSTWAGYVERVGEKTSGCEILVGKSEGKESLGRHRRSWKDNIKMYFKEIGFEGVGWINVAQDRDKLRAVWKAVMNFRVPQNAQISWPAEELLALPESFRSMYLVNMNTWVRLQPLAFIYL